MNRVSAAVCAALLLLGACGSDSDDSESGTADEAVPAQVVPLLEAVGETILGQDFSYPDGDTQVTASILTLQPGEDTGWHHHEAPLFAYIMEGAVTVDYGDEGERTYQTGEAIMEALEISHNGRTEGDGQVRILVANIGAAGVENSVADG
jgi:quercetin dioxygenase-like cupin family protein